jgi:hypothetical protein
MNYMHDVPHHSYQRLTVGEGVACDSITWHVSVGSGRTTQHFEGLQLRMKAAPLRFV